MKKVALSALIAGFFVISCNNSTTKKVEVKDTTAAIDLKKDTAETSVEK
ncbi:hypothetical protein [Sphingobacterium siyangense]